MKRNQVRGIRKRLLFGCIVVTVPVILVLLGAEILLRTFFPINSSGILAAYLYDEKLGVRVQPGTYTRLTDHLQEIRVNALGTINFQEDFEGYTSLVFAVGDSYTQGTGNPSDTAYPFLLNLELNVDESGRYHKRYGVVNLGLSAYGTRQALLAFREYRERIGTPSYVLYLGCHNDAEDDALFEAGYRHRHIVRGSPHWGWLVGPLQFLGRSEVFQRTKNAISSIRRGRVAIRSDHADALPAISAAQRQWPVIQELVREARAIGATPVLSWVPDEASYTWLRRQCREQGIAFADWWPAAESVRTAIETLPLTNAHSAGHYRSWVNWTIAREFAIRIQDRAPPAPAADDSPQTVASGTDRP